MLSKNKVLVSLLIALLIAGNFVSVSLLLLREPGRGSEAGAPSVDGDALRRLEEAIAALSARMDRLPAVAGAPAPRAGDGSPPAAAAAPDLGGIIERLEAIEKGLMAMRDADAELAAARLREERKKRFQAADGYIAADELAADKQYALAGNGYLEFLEHFPDHPDARDLLAKARDAFLGAGYSDKAFWVHGEMMKRFPDPHGGDLMTLANMEKDARRLDDAIRHAGEAAQLAPIEEDRVWRLMYRAWYIKLRDGDAAGLHAYREVEQLIDSLGMTEKNPGKKIRERIGEIENRLAGGR